MFVWDNPYVVDYGAATLVVVADDIDAARQLAKRALDGRYPWRGTSEIDVESTDPTRVTDVPTAEFYEWRE